jgi:hypothetical protein
MGTEPPSEILNEVASELEAATKGELESWVGPTQLADRIVLALLARNRRVVTVANLLEVSHRIDDPYPAAIKPPENELPEFLKRERHVVGAAAGGLLSGMFDHTIKNHWICGTPRELRMKLVDLCKSDPVQAKIVSLRALRPSASIEELRELLTHRPITSPAAPSPPAEYRPEE